MRFGRIALIGVAALGVACGSDTFTVGGTVTGLKGRGFTLQNNGGEPLAIEAAGPFTFPDKFEEGAAYAITIGTPPSLPRQSCGVQNGTGKVGQANVSDVQVVCTTNSYSVGGTVSGLVDASVTVQLNGGQSITLTNGPFTFPNRLEDQSGYTALVTANPPEHDCSIQGATGVVNGADVSSLQVNCPQKTYSIGGTVQGLTGGTLLLRLGQEGHAVVANDRFVFNTRLPKGASYSVSIGVQPEGQRCLLSNQSGTVDGDEGDIAVQCYPYFQLTDSPLATRVIGQRTFSGAATHQGGSPGAGTLSGPTGNPVLAGGRLYISDSDSNRILGFTGVPTASGAEASFVLGQQGFQTVTRAAGQGGLAGPQGLASDGTRLAVADAANNRVLLYNTLPTTTGAQPNNVVGQLDFASTTSGCDPVLLSGPTDVFFSNGRLIVADTGNHRVLVWNSVPTSNGAPADLVLGQRGFTNCVANDANGDRVRDANPAANTLNFPNGVWTDGTRLAVADNANNRVLIWNQFPTRDGQPADVVVGQSGFATRVVATTATGLSAPCAVRGTPLQLFVADCENHRVLVWNQFPTANGAAASVVLGQRDFVSKAQLAPPTSESLSLPSGILFAWPHVGVVDSGNHRVLLFESR
jgi:hypothetical protein